MTADEFEVVWPELITVAPKNVVFTGGEPLSRPDVFDLLAALRNVDSTHSIKRCLNSNGHLMSPQVARRLVGLVDEVRISLDGLRDTNDALRGEGNFDAALSALDVLQEAGFEPKVLVTLTSITLGDLEPLVEILLGRNITKINLNGFRPIGRGARRTELRPARHSVAQVLDGLRDHVSLEETDQDHEGGCQAHCGAGQFLNILPNGDVFPCHVLTNREFCCGNLRQQSLSQICARDGMLGQLAGLDFRTLASEDVDLQPLTVPKTCMGTVYAQTRNSPVWRQHLPIIQIQGLGSDRLRGQGRFDSNLEGRRSDARRSQDPHELH
jgi:MoaA/NifB/PqqE/SkfB family radical SAM enzyme